eukprot:jgi/Mesvir1/27253/Mv07093-RA.3
MGEILAGIVLGPSVLGRIPGFTDVVFPTAAHIHGAEYPYDSTVTFGVIANAGLIFFMFLMGLELDRGLLRKHVKASFPIAVSALAVPFCVGIGAAVWLMDINDENQPDTWVSPSKTAFLLFVGASMTFTAFPVLAAILSAAKLMHRPIGVLAMSVAAIQDIVAWCILAISSSFAKSGSPINGVYTLVLAVTYVLVMVLPIRVALQIIHARMLKRGWVSNRYYFCFLTIMLLTSAYCTEAIGIHSFFGAFLMGLITPQEGGFAELLFPRMELVTVEILLPLYFANSGIRTNIGVLDTARYWGITLVIILLASSAKIIPATLSTKIVTKRSWRYSGTIGILMNTRGLVEIIALNIGLTLGVLSTRLFTMLVLMAIATTLLTAPTVWVLFQRKFPDGIEPGDPLKPEHELDAGHGHTAGCHGDGHHGSGQEHANGRDVGSTCCVPISDAHSAGSSASTDESEVPDQKNLSRNPEESVRRSFKIETRRSMSLGRNPRLSLNLENPGHGLNLDGRSRVGINLNDLELEVPPPGTQRSLTKSEPSGMV